MEVSGRKANTDVAAGSAEVTPLCEPCQADGKRLEAHGFCNNCKEYICPSCIRYHGKLKATKHHYVLGKQTMPTHYQSNTKSEDVSCFELCKYHPSEAIKFFCPAHAQLGCGDCIVLNHRTCKVDYIPKEAPAFTKSREFMVIVKKMTQLETDLNIFERILKSKEQSVHDMHEVQVEKLKQFRIEINNYLDKREKALIQSMDNAREKEADRIRRLREDILAAKSTLAEAKASLKVKDKNVNHVYVTARHAQQMFGDMQSLIKRVQTKNKVMGYRFSRDMKTEDILYSEDTIGRIDEQNDFFTAKWSRATDIRIKTSVDTSACRITGSALIRPGTLLLADCNNRCVKTLDLTTRKVTGRLAVDGGPWDMCVLPRNRAAVTLPGLTQSMIQFINIGNVLETAKCISVPALCRGISHNNDRLYLTFADTSPRIEVRTVNGVILQTINNTTLQQEVFCDPYYLTISQDDVNTIYVSDYNNTVIKLSLQGELLDTFPLGKLSYGLVDVGESQVIVCCSKSSTVLAISGLDGMIKPILGMSDGMHAPYTVAFCPTLKKLIVGGHRNHVNVYIPIDTIL